MGRFRRALKGARRVLYLGAGDMSERRFTCPDGTEWKVAAAIRSSPFRMELVVERVGSSDVTLRCEVQAAELSQLSDEELCFLVGDR